VAAASQRSLERMRLHDPNEFQQRPTVQGKHLDRTRMNRPNGKINLKLVAEVLEEHGLDPTVELVRIIQGDALDDETRARLLNELLQYTQPKLKSIEVRAKVAATAFDLGDDQAKRLAEEFLKSAEFTELLK